ncbi:hypothetical protein NUACC21_07650 [Scytonema sp. NUACC21]
MSYLYLLDTNIISEIIKNPRGEIFSKIQNVGEDTVCTSIIVTCESRFGAKKKNSQKLIEKLEIIFDSIEILPLTHPVEQYYAEIRTDLEQQGKLETLLSSYFKNTPSMFQPIAVASLTVGWEPIVRQTYKKRLSESAIALLNDLKNNASEIYARLAK